jgi:hypothetical protein
MTTKLIQKRLFKGTQEFEIVDDAVNIHIKSPFKKDETLTVMLAVLNPEPIISQSRLQFTSRVNNEALISLYLAKPNAEEFNAFVNLLKQKAQDEYNEFAGLSTKTASKLEGNVYDEPPDFEATDKPSGVARKPVRVEAVEESINMLSEYIGGEEIDSLLSVLKALQSEPENIEHLSRLAREFDALGPGQGAVLTYAPYIGILLSDGAPRNL